MNDDEPTPLNDDIETTDDGFASLGLRDELLATLDDLGYEEPTPIQRETIPLLLTGTRPARSGRHRHRQDRGVRAAGPRS